jgi:hypothetical protein
MRTHAAPVVLAIGIVLGAVACAKEDPTITRAFTARMQVVDEDRARVEDRVTILKADCAQGHIGEPYCSNGRSWYTDNVLTAFNGWITAVQSDLTKNSSLENVTTYDSQLARARANAKAFNTWVDKLHESQGPELQGANAAPGAAELIPPLAEAAATIWQQYQAGEKAKLDALKSQMDTERFRSFTTIGSS